MKLVDDEVLNVRDYLNDGGKALVAGKFALQGGWDQFLYNPLGAPPAPFCKSNQTDPPATTTRRARTSTAWWSPTTSSSTGSARTCPIGAAADNDQAAALPFQEAGGPFGSAQFTLNGEDSAQNQDNVYSFLTTSSILPAATYPQFDSEQAIKFDRPAVVRPADRDALRVLPGGRRQLQAADADGRPDRQDVGDLSFTASYDTEPGWDYLVVEAHTVGQDDWTTLPGPQRAHHATTCRATQLPADPDRR